MNRDKIQQDFMRMCTLRARCNINTDPETLRHILFATELGNYKLFKNKLKETIGYIVWASLAKESITQLEHGDGFPISKHEWGEGRLLVIREVVFCPTDRVDMLKHLRHFLRKQRYVGSVRRNIIHHYYRTRDSKQRQAFRRVRQVNRVLTEVRG